MEASQVDYNDILLAIKVFFSELRIEMEVLSLLLTIELVVLEAIHSGFKHVIRLEAHG